MRTTPPPTTVARAASSLHGVSAGSAAFKRYGNSCNSPVSWAEIGRFSDRTGRTEADRGDTIAATRGKFTPRCARSARCAFGRRMGEGEWRTRFRAVRHTLIARPAGRSVGVWVVGLPACDYCMCVCRHKSAPFYRPLTCGCRAGGAALCPAHNCVSRISHAHAKRRLRPRSTSARPRETGLMLWPG